jgi:hypothetical protein
MKGRESMARKKRNKKKKKTILMISSFLWDQLRKYKELFHPKRFW